MHFTAQVAYITVGSGLFEKLEWNSFFLPDLLKNLWLNFQGASVIDDSIVNFFIILMARFSEFDFKAN